MELILVIVVLVLLFGGGGGFSGSQSRLLVTGRLGLSDWRHSATRKGVTDYVFVPIAYAPDG